MILFYNEYLFFEFVHRLDLRNRLHVCLPSGNLDIVAVVRKKEVVKPNVIFETSFKRKFASSDSPFRIVVVFEVDPDDDIFDILDLATVRSCKFTRCGARFFAASWWNLVWQMYGMGFSYNRLNT